MTGPEERPLSDTLRIFSGSSHPCLAREIAEDLGCRLCDRETRRFTNDNLFVRLGESVSGKDVIIIQSFSPDVSDNLLELADDVDAARSASAKTVHAVIPVLFLCPVRQEGRAAHLDRGAVDRRVARPPRAPST